MSPRKRLAPQPTKPAPQPVQHVKPSPLVWRTALDLAGQDRFRLTVEQDGSVIVHNRRVRVRNGP